MDYLVLVTPEAKEYYASNYGLDLSRIKVVPNYADVSRLSKIQIKPSVLDQYQKKFMLVYFGDTGLRRGTKTILEAARMLKEEEVFHFVIIGKSREQDLLWQYKQVHKLTNVELTGFLDFDTIMSYVAASKAGLCPFLRNIHHDTTYSNKMFQYMYYGKPVIASNCTSQQNLIEQANCGFIFKAGDADDLVLSIKKLYASEAYPRLSSNARESVLETYNSEKGYTELLEIYNQAPKKSSVS